MTATEQLAIDLFNRKYGSELTSRFEKWKYLVKDIDTGIYFILGVKK